MLRLTLIAAALFGQSPEPPAQLQWPEVLGLEAKQHDSPLLQRLREASKRPVTGGVDVSGLGPWSPSAIIPPALLAAEKERLRKMLAEKDTCLAMANHGNLAVACHRLEDDLVETPSDLFALPLMDLELNSQQFSAAFEVAVSLVAFTSTGKYGLTEGLLLRASLAAAGIGKVYSGQREFCVRTICVGDTDGQIRTLLPQGNTAQVICCLSAMAIGSDLHFAERDRDAIIYLETAAVLDPGNAFALYRLADSYVSDNFQYSKAIRALEDGLSRSGTGSIHAGMVSALDLYQKDYARVGDGKPAYPVPNQTQPTGTQP
jgi:hypothetical protein